MSFNVFIIYIVINDLTILKLLPTLAKKTSTNIYEVYKTIKLSITLIKIYTGSRANIRNKNMMNKLQRLSKKQCLNILNIYAIYLGV